ncbi:MAG: ribose-phosphate pyrophosphokinase [Spirochaetales bacterium]|nr:ribose-phosphate pyrophosphokinase [Spirochaetales bacterium]
MARSRDNTFVIPPKGPGSAKDRTASLRGSLLIAACDSGRQLAESIAARYRELSRQEPESGGAGERETGTPLLLADIEHAFSDTETGIRLPRHVGGADAFLVQCLYDPEAEAGVNQNYLAFLLAARAFRENGAAHVTAVLPYLAYARQDKPSKFSREPTSARLLADLSIEAGIDGLIAWAPHSTQARGFYGMIPVHLLDPLNMFLREFRRFRGREDVVAVAPDAGAAKMVSHFGRRLGVDLAVASKRRPRPEAVEITSVIGDFSGKTTAVVLDDMIGTGGTVDSVIRQIAERTEVREIHLAAGHNLCRPEALQRITGLHDRCGLASLVTTDSIPQSPAFRSLPWFRVRSLADMLCRTVNRVHHGRSVSELFLRD